MTVPSARDRLPRYLNADGGWLGLTSEGLELASDGSLVLARVPDAGEPVGPLLTGVEPGGAPAGTAVTDRTVGTAGASGPAAYVTDPTADVVWALAPCTPPGPDSGPNDSTHPVNISWTQVNSGSFQTPRGLLLGPRRRLYVADAGHDAVQVLELVTGALVGYWDGLREPWSIGAGADGRLYVLDRGGSGGTGRVQRFTPDGVLDSSFGTAMSDAGDGGGVHSAERMTTIGTGDDWRLLIVDRPADPAEPDRIVVLDAAGATDTVSTGTWSHPTRRSRDLRTGVPLDVPVSRIGGLAATTGPDGIDRMYVVDAGSGEMLVFGATGAFVGIAATGTPPVADVGLDADGRLWTYPPASASPQPLRRHDPLGSRVRRGLFVVGPVAVDPGDHHLGEVRIDADSSVPVHLALASTTTTGSSPDPAGLPGIATWMAPLDAAAVPWTALPSGSPVTLLPPGPGTRCWIGGVLSGDGTGTPVVRQAAVVIDPTSWLDHLPAVYRNDPAGADFLERFLRVIRSVQSEESTRADDLALLFDPATAPDFATAGAATALDRLAGWLDVDLDETWSPPKRRDVLASSFALQAIRGTPDGLREAVLTYLGLAISISEPAQEAGLWQLDVDGLDEATMLCPAPFDGAVLGTTAVVDQSTLTAGDDLGSPLFADLAHRFCVKAMAADVARAGGRQSLVDVIDREKPAHTAYRLCLAEADMRVGMNARVGVDSIVGGAPADLRLDTTAGELGASMLAPATGPAARVGAVTVGGLRLV